MESVGAVNRRRPNSSQRWVMAALEYRWTCEARSREAGVAAS